MSSIFLQNVYQLLSDTVYVESRLIWILRVSELQQPSICPDLQEKKMGSTTKVLFQTIKYKSE